MNLFGALGRVCFCGVLQLSQLFCSRSAGLSVAGTNMRTTARNSKRTVASAVARASVTVTELTMDDLNVDEKEDAVNVDDMYDAGFSYRHVADASVANITVSHDYPPHEYMCTVSDPLEKVVLDSETILLFFRSHIPQRNPASRFLSISRSYHVIPTVKTPPFRS